MLLPIEIDVSQLMLQDCISADIKSKSAHDDFIDVWLRHGVLVYGGNSFHESPVVSQSYRLPVDIRKKWQTAFQHCPRVRSINRSWDGFIDPVDLAKSAEHPTLIVIEDEMAESVYLLPPSEYSSVTYIDGKTVEVIRFSCIRRSRLLQEATATAASQITKGTEFKRIWADRFLWLVRAENLRQISVVDPWALKNFGPLKNLSANEICGTQRFFYYLSESSHSDKYVKLYTSWGDAGSAWSAALRRENGYRFAEMIKSQILSHDHSKVQEVEINIVHRKDFRKIYHDRYIRFGDYVIDLGNGLTCFEGEASAKDNMLSAFKCGKDVVKAYKVGEEQLREIRNEHHMRLVVSRKGVNHLSAQR